MKNFIIYLTIVLFIAGCGGSTGSGNGSSGSSSGSSGSGGADITPITMPEFSNTNKQQLVDFVKQYYDNNANNDRPTYVEAGGGCEPLKLSDEIQSRTLNRLNFYRAMVGFDGKIEFKADFNDIAHDVALIMSKNDALTHYPPKSYDCWSQSGYDGASHSNIASGSSNASAIDGYILDSGSGNEKVGHRRWIFAPDAKYMGHGATMIGSYIKPKDALYVKDKSGVKSTKQPDFVAWPSAGYFPKKLFPKSPISKLDRWSFAKNNEDFTNATVSMTKNGETVSNTSVVTASGNSYLDSIIVWEPSGDNFTNNDGDRYEITITTLKKDSYTYWVEIVDTTK